MCSAGRFAEPPEDGELLESPRAKSPPISPWDTSSSSDELLARSTPDDGDDNDDVRSRQVNNHKGERLSKESAERCSASRLESRCPNEALCHRTSPPSDQCAAAAAAPRGNIDPRTTPPTESSATQPMQQRTPLRSRTGSATRRPAREHLSPQQPCEQHRNEHIINKSNSNNHHHSNGIIHDDQSNGAIHNASLEQQKIDSSRFSPEELGVLTETELVVQERGIEIEILRLQDLLLAIQQERQKRLLAALRVQYPNGSRLTRTREPIQFCANRIWAVELAMLVDARRQSDELSCDRVTSVCRASTRLHCDEDARRELGRLHRDAAPKSDGGSTVSTDVADTQNSNSNSNNNNINSSNYNNSSSPQDFKASQSTAVEAGGPKDGEPDEKPPPPPPGRPRLLYTMDAINGLVYEVVDVDLSGEPALTPSGLKDPTQAQYVFGKDKDSGALILLDNITHLFSKFAYLNASREA